MANPLTPTPVPKRLPAPKRRQLHSLVLAHGLARVANASGLDAETITRALANVTPRLSTTAALLAFLSVQR